MMQCNKHRREGVNHAHVPEKQPHERLDIAVARAVTVGVDIP